MVPEPPLYLDSCVVLNVYATRRFEEILEANRPRVASSFIVTERVTQESMHVGNRGGADWEEVTLQSALDHGVLRLDRLESDSETATFVRLAAVLDDGEAETGAVAFHRKGAVATDDRAAIRAFSALNPPLHIVRTSELLKEWAEKAGPSEACVRQALNDIRNRARFVPNVTDPFQKWWVEAAA